MRAPGGRGRRGPSLTTSWGLLAWLLVPLTAIVVVGPVREADVYWHIRMGADILGEGRLTGDPAWTYGPSLAWATTQAGAELLLHALYVAGSWGGLVLFRIVMAAVVMVSVLLACTRVVRRRPVLVIDRSVALVGLVVAVAMAAFVQERPQSLSLALLPWVGVVLLGVLYADRWPRWWVVGLVVMVWSWFHGAAVVVGPLLALGALIHALGADGLKWPGALIRSIRRGWAVVLAALVAPMIGPLGLSYYPQVAAISEAASGRILEWQAPPANAAVVWLALTLIGIWAFALVRIAAASGRVWRTFRMDLMLVVVLAVAMTTAGRYLGIGLLVLAPLVARRLAQAWTRPAVRVERIGRAAAVAVLAVVSAGAVVLTVLAVVDARPVKADHPLRVWTALAAQGDDRRVFVDYALGGEAGVLGETVVSIDGRADRYGGAGIDAHRRVVDAQPGWEEVFARYPGTTDVVVLRDAALADRLESMGWRLACVDGSYVWLTAPGVAGECSPADPA